MKIVKVDASKKYNVVLGRGLLAQCGGIVSEALPPCRALVVTDDIVDTLYSKTVIASLSGSGFKCEKFVVENGEKSKNGENFFKLLEFLAEKQFHRSDAVIALGGGVVGDLAGFAASSYMRGIKFVQIPTTLLAGIDSSVGGKTAINLSAGKNLAGSFYQPEIVVFDLDTLKTLDAENLACGKGEAVKYAVIEGGDLFDIAENGIDESNLERLCGLCIEAKRDIVQSDETEQHQRKILNLGHTFAHAFEKQSGYTLGHGQAVGAGIYEIARISNKNAWLSAKSYERIVKMLAANGLAEFDFDREKLAESVVLDKKAGEDFVAFVVIDDIGKCRQEIVLSGKLGEFLK